MGANIGQNIGQGVKMNEALYEELSKRTGSANRRVDQDTMEEFFTGWGMDGNIMEPEKLPPMSGPVTMDGGTVLVPRPKRGSVLQEAITTINGERQDVYGSPEDSFALIARYWDTYLNSVGDFERIPKSEDDGLHLTPSDVAMMMTLFKVAREANQHKRDNIVDAAGYLGIYADMQGEE